MAGVLLHEGAPGSTEVLQKGLGEQEVQPGLHPEHARSWRGAEGVPKGQRGALPTLTRRAGQPGGPYQWDRLPALPVCVPCHSFGSTI